MTTLIHMSVKDYIVLTMIIACLLVYVLMKRADRRYSLLQKILKSEYEDRLIEEGVKITVPFDRCKISTKKSYSTKPASSGYRAQALNSLLDSRNAEVTTQHTSSTIEIKLKINGSTKTLKSGSLPIDKETLLIKLYIKKEIDVYYDVNTRDYLIDLHFLD
ncbi:hypothetical protein ABS768_16915 [Flavobacterium sp. ST-75]|uniref:Uncharacterized protein n=1 Tax=Flavobacterium rhizophilum TaxID=3163296 RepID=A0ABW8YIZ1_9FLAO